MFTKQHSNTFLRNVLFVVLKYSIELFTKQHHMIGDI